MLHLENVQPDLYNHKIGISYRAEYHVRNTEQEADEMWMPPDFKTDQEKTKMEKQEKKGVDTKYARHCMHTSTHWILSEAVVL